jgi:hypothetical protein
MARSIHCHHQWIIFPNVPFSAESNKILPSIHSICHVNKKYIEEVVKIGATFIHASKWLNGITVKAETDSFTIKVSKLPFVKEFQLTKGAG